MLKPSVVKATRSVSRREGRSNPPDLSDECGRAISQSYPTLCHCTVLLSIYLVIFDGGREKGEQG